MIANVTILTGEAFVVEKRNLPRDAVVVFPEGSFLLFSEPVFDEETGAEELEIWLAVPPGASTPTEVVE